MPKQIPSLPIEILWARLGDRSALSDELWLSAAQVALLLGGDGDQTTSDLKFGPLQPVINDDGTIRYRLGNVRDQIFGSTTDAKISADQCSLGAYNSLQVWADTASSDESWPFLIRSHGDLVDFWESLTMGDQLTDFHHCDWLRRDEYLEIAKGLAIEREFIGFVEQIQQGRFESVRPSQLATSPFDIISTPRHLHWIRELLIGSTKGGQALGQMAMATLSVAMQCKSDAWGLREGICFLLDINPEVCTGASQETVDRYVRAAAGAMRNEILPHCVSEFGETRLKPTDLLAWAKENEIPISPHVEALVNGKAIGAINPRRKPGAKPDPVKELRAKIWRHVAFKLMKQNPKMTFSKVAEKIHRDWKFGDSICTYETIRKELSTRKMIEDGHVLPPGHWRR